MKRLLLILSLCFLSAGAVSASNPSEEWKAYRMARLTSNGQSPEVKVKIWQDYLAKYPNGPYRQRALEELAAAARSSGRAATVQDTTSDCLSPFDMDAALGVSSTPSVAPTPAPALVAPDRLQAPPVASSSKRPVFAGLRSVGFTYAGSIAGSLLAESGSDGMIPGVALMASSMIIGPSMGHLYSGDKNHARKMIGARALAAGAMALGAYQLNSPCDLGPCSSDTNGLGLIVAGASVGYVLVLYDLVDSFFTVQRMQGRPFKNRLQNNSYNPRYYY